MGLMAYKIIDRLRIGNLSGICLINYSRLLIFLKERDFKHDRTI